jgi:hypothetical protein
MDKYGIQFATVAIDNELLKATPVPDDGQQVLFAAPSRPGCRIEVLSVSLCYAIVPVDGSNVATYDLSYYDASANSATVLLDDADALSTNASLIAYENYTVWVGVQSLDPGDTITAKYTITTPDTAGLGGLWTVAYRVKEWNGE